MPEFAPPRPIIKRKTVDQIAEEIAVARRRNEGRYSMFDDAGFKRDIIVILEREARLHD